MRVASLVLLGAIAACAPASRRSPSSPTTPPAAPAQPPRAQSGAFAAASALPPVPLVEGPLAPRVVYPRAGALIQSRDSNFIFGSVGNGKASLSVNGHRVPVLPNGSWIAFLPVPRTPISSPAVLPSPVLGAVADSSPTYELLVTLGSDTARLSHPVRVLPPPPPLPLTGRLAVDSASITPRGALSLRDQEPVRVAVRAPVNASVWVQLDSGVRRSLLNDAARRGGAGAGGEGGRGGAVGGEAVEAGKSVTALAADGALWATDVPARLLRGTPTLVVARGADTIRLPITRVAAPPTDPVGWAAVGAVSAIASDTDRVVIARPTPGGTYKWFLLPGTQLQITGRIGEFTRVRLDELLEAWISTSDVRPLEPGTAGPTRVAGNARLVPAAEWVDLMITMADRPAFAIEERPSSIELTLYDTRADTDILTYVNGDSLVRVVRWRQETNDRARFTLELSAPPFGYLTFWDRGRFVLRVRRPPRVDARQPLRGLTIAIDPGHPPIGATGPTGLWEPVATLAIGERLRTMLEERGARVVMTRTTPEPVALSDRPAIARRSNAHVLVSIHLNALPDGVNPFSAHGTGTYFFHPQAEPLARAVQKGMVKTMGLRNLGIYYDNLALARPTWMPSILCEGAFIMIPEQEAALRIPSFQAAYARGVADGLQEYFGSLGR